MERYPPHIAGARPGMVGHRTVSFENAVAGAGADSVPGSHPALHPQQQQQQQQPQPSQQHAPYDLQQQKYYQQNQHNLNHPLHQPPSGVDLHGQSQFPQASHPPPLGAGTVITMPPTNHAAVGRPTSYTVFQTTNVDSSHPDYQSPAVAALAAAAPPPPATFNPRSCVTCRRRKVRCDKRMPCSHCVRNKVPCVFPAPGRAPRKPRARDASGPPLRGTPPREVAEIRQRLRRLEEMVREISEQITTEPRAPVGEDGRGRQLQDTPSPDYWQEGAPDTNAASLQWKDEDRRPNDNLPPAGRSIPVASDDDGDDSDNNNGDDNKAIGQFAVRAKGERHYVSDGVWSRLNEELEEIRRATEMLDIGDSEYEEEDHANHDLSMTAATETAAANVDDHHAFALGYSSADFDLEPLRLESSTLSYVWKKYLDNVEVWIKMVHVPSMAKIVNRASDMSTVLDAEEDALMFSMIYSTIVSLENDEAKDAFGLPKDVLLVRYRVGVEQALAKAKFLTTSSLMVLQAMVMFASAVAAYDDTRFPWSLVAIVVRIALGMGMHRDGTRYGLSPFETEMRRRVWWYLVVVDQRSAEGVGTGPILRPDSFDTQLPSNINDEDMSPESTEIPPERPGHSDCAPSLVRLRIVAFMRRMQPKALDLSSSSKDVELPSPAVGDRAVREMVEYINSSLLSKCNPIKHPAYWMAELMTQFARCRFIMTVNHGVLSSATPATKTLRERYFVVAYKIVLYADAVYTDPCLRQWQWIFRSFPQWNAVAVTLMEAPRMPWSSMMELWWEGLHTVLRNMPAFGPTGPPDRGENWMDESKYSSLAWLPLQKLIARVRKHRAAELARLQANPEEARRTDAEDETRARNMFSTTVGVLRRIDDLRMRWKVLVGIEGDERGGSGGSGGSGDGSGTDHHGPITAAAGSKGDQTLSAPTTNTTMPPPPRPNRQRQQQQQQQQHQQHQQQHQNQRQQQQKQVSSSLYNPPPQPHSQAGSAIAANAVAPQQTFYPTALYQPAWDTGSLAQQQQQQQQPITTGHSLDAQSRSDMPQYGMPPNVMFPQDTLQQPQQQGQVHSMAPPPLQPADASFDIWSLKTSSVAMDAQGEWMWSQPGFGSLESPDLADQSDVSMDIGYFDWNEWNKMSRNAM